VSHLGGLVTFDPYEIARLLLSIILLPFIWALFRRLRWRAGMTQVVVAVVAIYCSYAFTVAEDLIAHDLMNVAQHLCYAVAGVAAAWAVVDMRLAFTRRSAGTGR
jgi:peptidoglycan/LPS O-acetylase OafA/YrhL